MWTDAGWRTGSNPSKITALIIQMAIAPTKESVSLAIGEYIPKTRLALLLAF